MLFSVYNRLKIMQQKKVKRLNRDSKPSIMVSHLGQKVSTLASNRSQDTKSKIHLSSRDSYIRQFKKPKIKLSTLSALGSLGIEEQIKKEIVTVAELLNECQLALDSGTPKTTKQQLLTLEQLIRVKDQTIKSLNTEIQSLKKNDRIVEEDSPDFNRMESDREPLFKLAEEMKHEREELNKRISEHHQKNGNYHKIKKMIEQIEVKYTNRFDGKGRDPHYHGPALMTYQEFKQRQKNRKEQATPNAKVKKIDFYHHLSPEKQPNPTRNMKDLITRKTITIAALKNSRKKHGVEMGELLAKLDFLKDQDAHLNQKIKEKEQELGSMQRKFSERRFEHQKLNRSPLLHFNS